MKKILFILMLAFVSFSKVNAQTCVNFEMYKVGNDFIEMIGITYALQAQFLEDTVMAQLFADSMCYEYSNDINRLIADIKSGKFPYAVGCVFAYINLDPNRELQILALNRQDCYVVDTIKGAIPVIFEYHDGDPGEIHFRGQPFETQVEGGEVIRAFKYNPRDWNKDCLELMKKNRQDFNAHRIANNSKIIKPKVESDPPVANKPQLPATEKDPDASKRLAGADCFEYTIIVNCNGSRDTVDNKRVQCPAPDPKVFNCDGCADSAKDSSLNNITIIDEVSSWRIQPKISGRKVNGQQTLYGYAGGVEIVYQPNKWAIILGADMAELNSNPDNDRPHKWSDLFEKREEGTGKPLTYYRAEYRREATFYLGVERTFHLGKLPNLSLGLNGGLVQLLDYQETSNFDKKNPINTYHGPEHMQRLFALATASLSQGHWNVRFGIGGKTNNDSFRHIPENPDGGNIYSPKNQKDKDNKFWWLSSGDRILDLAVIYNF